MDPIHLEEYWFPNLEQFTSGNLDVLILHELNGSKGLWQCVGHGGELGVTKEEGQRIKLQFGLPSVAKCENLQIQLLEFEASHSETLSDSHRPDFLLESIRAFENNLIEVELKLFRPGKKLHFFLQIPTTTDILFGKTVEFSVYHEEDKTSKENSISPVVLNEQQQQSLQALHLPEGNPNNLLIGPQLSFYSRLGAFSPQSESKEQIYLPSIQLLGLNNPSSILMNERSWSPMSSPSISSAHTALILSSSPNSIQYLIHHASESSSITTTSANRKRQLDSPQETSRRKMVIKHSSFRN